MMDSCIFVISSIHIYLFIVNILYLKAACLHSVGRDPTLSYEYFFQCWSVYVGLWGCHSAHKGQHFVDRFQMAFV